MWALDPWRARRRPNVDLSLRHPLFHPSFPTVLFWSEKSGCTTVAKWFFAQVGCLDKALAYSPWVHSYRTEVHSRQSGYHRQVREALLSGKYRAVKVVRDPSRRAVSSFMVLAESGAVIPGAHWVKDYWAIVERWLARHGRDPGAGLSFMEHLALVQTMQARRAKLDGHLAPQYLRNEESVLTEIVPIERFAAWTDAEAAAGRARPMDLARLGHSAHYHKRDDARTLALGPRPEEAAVVPGLYADGRFPDPDALINERSRPAIRAVYGADLAAYGPWYREHG